ncbi:polyphosphate polymerase domain-containing protein [Streptomyces zingiberis]|uniref:Polyphosphate polymerase domain-containing protein n=1 Tax=Streptomyces zingiberis TaxID=2053010 RepID=A0ABX1C230_9ACTN|nr:polyphosphate polymerase domain-containing protein [Streptomyces zingiberis]NJQ03473.1 polyphosphate polymerase domain-containing protein [Streptomyces zingiberis]
MSPARRPTALDALDPIGLEELLDRALLQTRIDRKYVLPAHSLEALVASLPAGTRVLEIDGDRRFAYRSLYFDTPDLISYRLAAHRRRRRFKVRTRLYEQSGECWLEVKTRGSRASTVKQRLRYERDDFATLLPGRAFVDAILAGNGIDGGARFALAPVLTTRYRRTTLYLPGSGSRVTLDTELTWRDGERELSLPGVAVVETKTGSTASAVDRLLWRSGRRPDRISKYATGLAALRPGLPATPWRRTLRRSFGGADPTPGTGRPAMPLPTACAV